jgi:hypothetical protein
MLKPMRLRTLGVLSLLAAAPASATVSEALSLDQLVGGADDVVVAVATSSQSQFDAQGRIVTDVEMQVEDSMKGSSAAGHILVVRRLGGYVGDLGMLVEGEPQFEVGGRYLVFLRRMTDGRTLRPVGMSQGVMSVVADAGPPMVHPGGQGLALVQRVRGGQLAPAPAALLRPERLDLVRSQIASIVAAGRVAP